MPFKKNWIKKKIRRYFLSSLARGVDQSENETDSCLRCGQELPTVVLKEAVKGGCYLAWKCNTSGCRQRIEPLPWFRQTRQVRAFYQNELAFMETTMVINSLKFQLLKKHNLIATNRKKKTIKSHIEFNFRLQSMAQLRTHGVWPHLRLSANPSRSLQSLTILFFQEQRAPLSPRKSAFHLLAHCLQFFRSHHWRQ